VWAISMAAPRSAAPSGKPGCAGAGYHAGGFHAEDGAEALAAGEGGVAHGAMDGVGFGGGRGEEALERCVGEGDAGGEDVWTSEFMVKGDST
jgi:hypothetical protein